MNYITLNPSLERLALVRVVVTLWNAEDIRALMVNFDFPSNRNERLVKWQVIENHVKEKILLLPQPRPLMMGLIELIKPIGLQILKWMEYHSRTRYLGLTLPRNLIWTSHGILDKKRTAEVIIKDESIDIAVRYKLACINCLKDSIFELWNEMPENCQKCFYNREGPMLVKQHKLVVFWTYDIMGEVARINDLVVRTWNQSLSPYQYAFESAALDCNEVATEYFLQKLTPQEREESLERAIGYAADSDDSLHQYTDLPKEHDTEVLCFLISQRNEEQQMKIFELYGYQLLLCLLDFPRQDFFMEAANRMWNFISENDHYFLLIVIVDRILYNYMDWDYEKLFGEFWQQSPTPLKKIVISACASDGFLLSGLIKAEHKENIRLMLRSANAKEKENIIFCCLGSVIWTTLVDSSKCHLLRFFIKECIPATKLIEFKMECKRQLMFGYLNHQARLQRDIWIKFFQFLDDLIITEGR